MEDNVTTTSTVTTRSVGIRYGIINGLIQIVYFLIATTAGFAMSSGFAPWIGFLISIVMLFLAHKYYKENGDGYMTYGQGIGIGFWTGLVSASISAIFTYIYAKIDSSYIASIREKAIQDMEAQGQSQQAIDTAMKFVEMFTSAESLLIMGLIFGIIGMLIIAVVMTIFTQRPQPETSI
jgi:hypothetical protein